MKGKNGAFAVIFRNKKEVLLIKTRDTHLWGLPGGGIEAGETSEEAVVREVKEETGFSIRILKKCGEYSFTNDTRKNYIFLCKVISGSMAINEEAIAVCFVDISDFPRPIHPQTEQWISDVLNEKDYVVGLMNTISFFYLIKHSVFYPQFVFRHILKRLKSLFVK